MADIADPVPPAAGAPAPDAKATAPKGPTAEQWLEDIQQAEKDKAKWTERAKKIEGIFLEERKEANTLKSQYALLWANVSVLQPAVYARQPQPVVTRRFSDRDVVARNVSEVMERSLVTIFEQADVDTCLKGVRDNFLIVAQGTAWVRYVPTFKEKEFDVGEAMEKVEALSDETLAFDFVHWSDFIHPKARRWEDLPWLGRRVYLDDVSGVKRFGQEKWDAVKNAPSQNRDDTGKYTGKPKGQTCVYEIWSKRDNQLYWLAKGYGDDFLDQKPPLYELKGFFPCPRPAYGTMPTDSLEPVPDYIYYQDQAEEINKLTARIGSLQDSLKLVGFYPAGAEGGISAAIETALDPGTQSKMIPVESWTAFVQGGGSKQMIEWLPIEMVVGVLQSCIEQRKVLIDDVFQITGISDIIRGSTAPNETATAQNIKTQWGSIRIRDRQTEMARFARDLTRIAAEIIAEKFQPETLWRLSGLQFPTMAEKQAVQIQIQLQMQMQQAMQQQAMAAQQAQPAPQGPPGAPPGPPGQMGGPTPPQGPQPPPKPPELPPEIKEMMEKPTQEELIALMQDDGLRSYRIDIETDSTIAADEQAEKASRQEFVTVVGTALQQAMPVAQQVPELVPVIGEMLLFLTRAYRTGRQLEDTIEQAIQAITTKAKMAVDNPPPPPPNPAMEKIQADAALGAQRLQVQAQNDAQKHQNADAKLQLEGHVAGAKIHLAQQDMALDAHLEYQRNAMKVPPSNPGFVG